MSSESNKHQLSYVAEVTPGVTPAAPRFQNLPDVRTTLAVQQPSIATERLTGTRFQTKPRRGAVGVTGNIPADLSFRAYDDLIAGALQGDWVDVGGAGEDTVDLTVNSAPFAAANVGDTFITPGGTVTLRSVDSKAQRATFSFDDGVSDVTEHVLEGSATTVIDTYPFIATAWNDFVEHQIVKAGDTRKYFSFMRYFSDMAGNNRLLFKGCEVSSWNLTADANGVAKSTFTLFGRTADAPAAAAPADSEFALADATEVFDTFSGQLKIDDAASCLLTTYNFTLENGHTPVYATGCAESQDPSVGDAVLTGSVTALFESTALLEKFLNDESLDIELTLQDPIGNRMVIDLPNLALTTGSQPDVTGPGKILLPLNFSAHYDTLLGSHIAVSRIEAA